MKNNLEVPKKPSMALVVLAGILCGVLWLMNLYILAGMTPTDRGTYGDMFGAVNSIFTGAAFVGVVYAVFLQRYEVKIAHSEIAHTKEILTQQQEQLALQNTEAKKQSFENTFFQLLRLLTEITENIDLVSDGRVTKGKDVFSVFAARISANFGRTKLQDLTPEEKYEEFYKTHKSELGHYFRTLYNVIKFVDASDIIDKKFYTNIVRAQISDSEVALIFYNCMSKHGREKLKPFVEKYTLLKNLNEEHVYAPNLREKYASSAFHTPS